MNSDSHQLLTIAVVAIVGIAAGAGVRLLLRVRFATRSLIFGSLGGVLLGLAVLLAEQRMTPVAIAMMTGIAVVVLVLQIDARDHHLDFSDALITAQISGIAMSLPLSAAFPLRHAPTLLQSIATFAGGSAGMMLMRRGRSRLLIAVLSVLTAAFVWLAVPRLRFESTALLDFATVLIIPIAAVCVSFARRKSRFAEIENEIERTSLSAADAQRAMSLFGHFRNKAWTNVDAWRRTAEILNTLAVRKQQQRRMDPGIARLHELELMKLRMDLDAMTRIEMSLRAEGSMAFQREEPTTRAEVSRWREEANKDSRVQ